MGLFSRKPDIEELRGYKAIKIKGMRFVIKRLNPFLDFPIETMPTIFTDFYSRHKETPSLDAVQVKKIQEDMQRVVASAVIEPNLIPIGTGDKKGREPGITAEDLFRDPDLGYKLYNTIMAHSLRQFGGLKGLFFYLRAKYWSFMKCRKHLDRPQLI